MEDTNLAGIGGDEDLNLRYQSAKAANWLQREGIGSTPGVEVWRVEKKNEVREWPKEQHGQFHRGDCYIVLETSADPDAPEGLRWDIHFWNGSGCSRIESGVAAFKAVELDDLLGGEALQHRQVEGMETEKFLANFPGGVSYLEGGIDYDFNQVSEVDDGLGDVLHLYQVIKEGKYTRYFEVPLACSSLDDSDAFLLDAGTKVYTWVGEHALPFERITSTALAQDLKKDRGRACECFLDVGDDNAEFWEILGGKCGVASAEEAVDAGEEEESADEAEDERHMYVVSDAEGYINVCEVPFSEDSLDSDDAFIIDCGDDLFVWVGKGSTTAEKRESMQISYKFLEELGRLNTARVHRIKEGQEHQSELYMNVFRS